VFANNNNNNNNLLSDHEESYIHGRSSKGSTGNTLSMQSFDTKNVDALVKND